MTEIAYVVETNGTPQGTRIWDDEGNEISSSTYRIVIDVHEPHASVMLDTYVKNSEGKIHIDPETNDVVQKTVTGRLASIKWRKASL